jgi:hypothetical protein
MGQTCCCLITQNEEDKKTKMAQDYLEYKAIIGEPIDLNNKTYLKHDIAKFILERKNYYNKQETYCMHCGLTFIDTNYHKCFTTNKITGCNYYQNS